MTYLRKATTRGEAIVHIFVEGSDYIIGAYFAESPKWTGWVPVRWSKLTPFYNGRCASGLDLIEDITRIRI